MLFGELREAAGMKMMETADCCEYNIDYLNYSYI